VLLLKLKNEHGSKSMKISINTKIREAAWGGSNQFVKSLAEYLRQPGHTVEFALEKHEIDLILMIHPSRNLRITGYDIHNIRNYLFYHPNTLLIQRINTCDERRGYGNENEIILEANKYADSTVFVSSFLRDLYVRNGFDPNRPHCVILNGADEEIFNPTNRADWKPNDKLKIVTHHWSSAYTKGFDIYERLDLLLGIKPFSDLFEFTFIGNLPKGLCVKHTRVIQPLASHELAQALKEHHVYLTASRNEPAGMHYIEGMCCGLPVLYLNSGSLPEYCSPYGIEFNLINFEQKLLEMQERYPQLCQKVLDCPYTGNWMAAKYEALFKELFAERCKNPVPRPGMAKMLKQRLIADRVRKAKRYWDLAQKARTYLER